MWSGSPVPRGHERWGESPIPSVIWSTPVTASHTYTVKRHMAGVGYHMVDVPATCLPDGDHTIGPGPERASSGKKHVDTRYSVAASYTFTLSPDDSANHAPSGDHAEL